MSALWPDDLCSRCPYSDMCDLTDPSEDASGECRRVGDWRDAMDSRMDSERGK
jgi:hypothetical protein